MAENLKPLGTEVNDHCLLGDVVSNYERIVKERSIDLLVFESSDESQMAMHSLGQSLAIQFYEKAILLV